ncbi:hypothetical protein PGT21_017969 [Puccinia graminis f. sp. tritici]|uniref:Uncharacterized protein n=1 Tax=Puccinia graminis f. sp. tritici TaxID=56615 RepID=A0A5B0NNM8_PUCGR|nr:hypothetical protein PGT21_017969 [Puccinia graminis f. sp. tritici]
MALDNLPAKTVAPKPATNPHPATTYTYHRLTTLLHTLLLSAGTGSDRQVGPHIKSNVTLYLKCDHLLQGNLKDTGPDRLKELDRIAIKINDSRCFGAPPHPRFLHYQFTVFQSVYNTHI